MATQHVTVDGRTEEEFRSDINRAIADTEDEIFREALSDQELDNDGDDSLEQMPDHPLDEDTEPPEDDEGGGELEAELEDEESAEEEPQEMEEELGEGEEAAEPPPQVREPERRQGIPSYRVREESEARRAAEERAIALERELAQMRGRMDELSTRVNQPPQQPQAAPARPPKPDRYTDEAGYDAWMLEEGRRQAREEYQLLRAQDLQQQQLQMAQRVEASFGAAANGEHRHMFLDAYDRLTHLDHRDPNNRALVNSIVSSVDPAASLFQWFEGYQQPAEQPAPRQRAVPRHEVRLPTRPPTRGGPPSLNSMGGGGPGQRVDPELYDDSDAAVFRYATR